MNEKDLAIECLTAAYERINKRLWILCIVIFLTCVATNIGWIYHESQYETVEKSVEVKQENESGNNNYIGNDGDINAETDGQNNN